MLPKSKQFHPQHNGVIEVIRIHSFQLSQIKSTVIVTDESGMIQTNQVFDNFPIQDALHCERINDQIRAVFISYKHFCSHRYRHITKIQFCDVLKNDKFCLVFVGSDRVDRSGSKFNLR